jgi:opacity protein-like surface antigen
LQEGALSRSSITQLCGSVLAAIGLLVAPPAWAEVYIAGMAGGVFPKPLSDVEEKQIPQPTTPGGTKATDLSLSRSIMAGAKVGYFFERAQWFGIEGEVYRHSPNVKQQNVTEVFPNGAPPTTTERPGSNLIVTNVNLNFVARAQLGNLEPYAGVGLGAFLQQWNMRNRENNYFPLSISSGRTGFVAEAGLRYRFLQHLAVFTEYKFNHARVHFDSPANVQATYDAHFLVFGLGYHF